MCYFTVGNKIFQQIIEIPTGSNPAPILANLFIYSYENKWLRKLQRSDLRRAKSFSNIYRFIDDLIALNDNKDFESCYKEIYPEELELGKENEGYQNASFLDLNIIIKNGIFEISLYDKRDSFPFTSVRMPISSSNMPSTIFYSSIGAEVLRIARAASNQQSFFTSARILLGRMLKQGAHEKKVIIILNNIFGNHIMTFSRFCKTSIELGLALL